ncbi:MAG: protein translocase subunit SecD [Spirochaetia bacterium]|nr:protein translocase subunit SecD [Spirochaetia bacterium]
MNKMKRFLLVLAVVAIAFGFLLPSIRWYFFTPEDQKMLATSSREQIREYALMLADEDLAVVQAAAKAGTGLDLDKYGWLADIAKKNYKAMKKAAPESWDAKAILAGFLTPSEARNAMETHHRERILKVKNLGAHTVQLGLDLSGGLSVVIKADFEALEAKRGEALGTVERADAMSNAMEVLSGRIDKFGLTEPVIRQQGEDRIYVEIPGTADPERINSIIMGRGRLAFHMVDDDATTALRDYLRAVPNGVNADLTVKDPSIVPAGFVVRKFYQPDEYGLDQWTGTYVVIRAEAGLDGNHIQSATTASDPIDGRPVVNFQLSDEGGEIFYKMTSENVGKSMAVVLDDRIKAYAVINEAIRSSVQMSGFSADEAQNIRRILQTAALPLELIVESQTTIGASLGEDAILQGRNAVAIGLLAVFLFMFAYYKGAGFNALVAQVLNLYLMLSILSAFNLTLTLPAIAGFVLTIGMAVDANVIIFERIKEEFLLGKGRRAAVDAGFDKAFWAVMDGNITTIIAALFLAQLGTGPIQGFAVSLAIGNISSLFTSLFVSRLIFDVGTEALNRQKISISWRIK